MTTLRAPMRRLLPVLALAGLMAAARAQDNPLRFGVRLSPDAAKAPVAGRLFVFMTNAKQNLTFITPGYAGLADGSGQATYTAAQEVSNLMPGRQVTLNPDTLAYPDKLSAAPKGDWQVMALLDRDHSFGYSGPGPGDLYSTVVRLKDLDPAKAGSISLVLTQVMPLPPPRKGVDTVRFTSPMLSRFWGRPIVMRAGVVLPPDYAANPKKRYPTVYHVHGFGGSDLDAGMALFMPLIGRLTQQEAMRQGKIPAMIHVFLDAHSPMGHTAFADSVNTGPWGTALVRELIPHLEGKYRMAGPKGRFLTGHSSGGWSTLWLQVTYPEAFNGTWSTSPDPVDFRSFTGVNLTTNPPENVYRAPDQTARNLMRENGRNLLSIQDFVRFEQVAGDYGGQFQSFDAVFSPKGDDGRPMPLFDRQTGTVDPLVARHWERYDINRILSDNWKTLGPKLRGKIHIVVGSADTFHLESAVMLLRDTLKAKGSDAKVEIIPGRDHGNLFDGGLYPRILNEMGERYKKTAR